MIGRDGTNKALDDRAGPPRPRAGGRDHQGLGRAGGPTKASNLRVVPPKASTAHGVTTAVTFRSDEVAWSMELRGDSITGLEAAAIPALGECKYSKSYIANVSHIFDILTPSV